jgi:DNA polymerase-1
VNARATLVNTMDNQCLDVEGVKRRFGIPPERIVDYLALMGDKIDNIPGVPGVGPKTAAKWLQQYGTLNGVIEHAGEIKGKIGEKLRAALDDLPLSYRLATIKCDVPLELSPRDLAIKPPDIAHLRELYQRYEFRAWLAALDESGAEKTQTRKETNSSVNVTDYQVILTEDALNAWLAKLEAAELIAFDTETNSINYAEARVVGMSFAVKPSEAAYLPLGPRTARLPHGAGAHEASARGPCPAEGRPQSQVRPQRAG